MNPREQPPITAIVADDYPLMRREVSLILESDPGVRVIGEAGDGFEAVALVDRLRPDVAVLDISMPGLNGIKATRLIKERHPGTLVIALSLYSDDEYVFGALEAGAAGHVAKDAAAVELLPVLRAALNAESTLPESLALRAFERFAAVGGALAPRIEVSLSAADAQLLRLASAGLSNTSIARSLDLPEERVWSRLRDIFARLGVASRTEAVVRALQAGLFEPADLEVLAGDVVASREGLTRRALEGGSV